MPLPANTTDQLTDHPRAHSGELDIKAWYDAVGDGTVDDTAAFASALSDGHKLFVPPGTYKAAMSFSGLQWKSIRGAGKERTIIKAPAAGTAMTFTGGLNHGLTFEDLSIVGAVTPAEKGILTAGASTLSGEFTRVQFRDLLFGVDTNNTTCETTGLHFTACAFDNAPLRFTGAAAHNTMTFDGKCRWAGLTQAVPAFEMNTTGAVSTNLTFVGPVGESLKRQWLKLTNVVNLVIDNPYCEFVNTDEAANTPWIDLAGGTIAGTIVTPYMNSDSAFAHVGIGTSGAPNIAPLVIVAPNMAGGLPPTITRSAFLNYVELGSGAGPDQLSGLAVKGQYRGAYFTNDNSAYPVFVIQYGPGTPVANSIRIQDASAAVIASIGPLGEIRSTEALGTRHVAAATPSGGNSGDIKVGNSKLWVNDAGTWKSVTVA